MGIFKTLFGSGDATKEDKKLLPWQQITTENQLEAIKEQSKTKTQLIFKHSTRCGISRMVLSQFEEAYNLDLNADLYYLDVLNYRSISDAIGHNFQVMHQSPQLLVIKNGITVAHASHGAINDIELA